MATSEYRTLFDARGARYNLANRLFPEARSEEAAEMLAHLPVASAGSWLDVGAGGGFLAQRAAASGWAGTAVGCDESLAFLSEARPYALRAAAEYGRLPFADEAFSAAACLAVLHHAEEPRRVLAEMLRVTRRGGRVAVGDVVADSRASRFLNEFVDRHTDTGHAGRFHSPQFLAALLERAGGCDVRSASAEIHWNFESRTEATRFCRELFGLRPGTEERDLEEALECLGLAASGGHWRLPWSMVFASAARA